jgi:hypothetical protein
MDWEPHVVRQGETLVRLAWSAGEDVVWRYEQNASSVAKQRKNPQILLPTDTLYLPVKAQETMPLATGQQNEFTAKVPKVSILAKVEDFAGAPCTAVVDGSPLEPGSVGCRVVHDEPSLLGLGDAIQAVKEGIKQKPRFDRPSRESPELRL